MDNMFDRIRKMLGDDIVNLASIVEDNEAAIRRLKKGLTISELHDLYRKIYKENYGVFYAPQFQTRLKMCQERGISEDVTPAFERSQTLYKAFDELSQLALNKDFTFTYKLPGEKKKRTWVSDTKKD